MTFHSSPHDSDSAATGSTRCFWWGTAAGAAAGLLLGWALGDIAGWSYMTGVCGSIAGIAFDQKR